MRRAIVFHLISVAEGNAPIEEIDGTGTDMTNLAQLRTRAKEASAETSERRSSEAQQTYFERSAVIRIYAVARAEGKCEACGNPAPFIDSSGKPFLEVHHIRRLTDGGWPRHGWRRSYMSQLPQRSASRSKAGWVDDLGSRMEQGSSPASDCRSVLISQISINNQKLSVIRMILT